MRRVFFGDLFFDANDIWEDDPFFNEEEDVFGRFDFDYLLDFDENSQSSEEEENDDY